MLNGLWLGFFLVAAASALARWLIGGDATVFAAMVESLFAMAKLAVEVMVLLFGTLTLWLGFLRIAEKAGLVERLAVLLGPLFRRLMPEVPPGHPAIGLITLNFAANGLGLDNAATPIGLKAMKALQELNPSSTTASNAQILFLVLNASSLTLLPVTIFMYRAAGRGRSDPGIPADPPGHQRLDPGRPVVGGADAAPALVGPGGAGLPDPRRVAAGRLHGGARHALGHRAGAAVLAAGQPDAVQPDRAVPDRRRAEEGAGLRELRGGGEGRFRRRQEPVAVPGRNALRGWRVARLRALEVVLGGIRWAVEGLGWDSRFVEALPTALVKPFSGSAARAMLLETMQTHGVDSFPALVAATVQGSTETTFYVLAVYFGSVGLQRARHAVGCALTADLAGVIASIAVCYWFFA